MHAYRMYTAIIYAIHISQSIMKSINAQTESYWQAKESLFLDYYQTEFKLALMARLGSAHFYKHIFSTNRKNHVLLL